MKKQLAILMSSLALIFSSTAAALVGDPQIKTDHEWYPGELSCSTMERMIATENALYTRETGRSTTSPEDKAIAAWYWYNQNYWHCRGHRYYYFSETYNDNGTTFRGMWTGMFGEGFSLCGTAHARHSVLMEYLLGHCTGRVAGVSDGSGSGHNSMEVWLTGGQYGSGMWVLLDTDPVSTIVFSKDQVSDSAPNRLLGIHEINTQTYYGGGSIGMTYDQIMDVTRHNHGWRICGEYDGDKDIYKQFDVAEYEAAYEDAPPMIVLRKGETFRRYLKPGLGGTTYAFWGANDDNGPEDQRTWVNQPERMWSDNSSGTGWHDNQVKYANGVYTYSPDFSSNAYKEAVWDEDAGHVTLEFTTPYIIAATPPSPSAESFEANATNGLVITGDPGCSVQASVTDGETWSSPMTLNSQVDLTDNVKGRMHYLLRFNAGAAALAGHGITVKTVVQASPTVIPRLKDGGSTVTYQASGKGVMRIGPNTTHLSHYIVDGAVDSDHFTVEMTTPRGEPVREIYAAAWVSSGAPPNTSVNYNIDYSTDGGGSWTPIVSNWKIIRQGWEPGDWWSQSFVYGRITGLTGNITTVQLRFNNDGGRTIKTADVSLVYATTDDLGTNITFNWTDNTGNHQDSHTYPAGQTTPDSSWTVSTGTNTTTNWVEYEVTSSGQSASPTALTFTADRTNYPNDPASQDVAVSVISGTVDNITGDPAWMTLTHPALPASSNFTLTAAVSAAGLADGDYSANLLIDGSDNDVTISVSFHVADYAGSADSDGDNMPDDWETAVFGNLSQDGTSDYDGDGTSNLAEYQNGSNPTTCAKSKTVTGCNTVNSPDGGAAFSSLLVAAALFLLAGRHRRGCRSHGNAGL